MIRFLRWMLHMVLDMVIPPVVLTFLMFYVPISYFFRSFMSFAWRKSYYEPSGKVVLITGASSGIGKHVALEFARRRSKLVLVGRNEDQLREVSSECTKNGSPSVAICQADLSKRVECKKILDYTKTRFRELHYLICNAGITSSFFVENLESPTAFEAVMDTDFWGYIWTTYYALPELRKTRGSILANSSIEAFMPIPRHAIYNAAKAGILQFFDTLRNEPIGKHVKITVVMPGPTESGITQGRIMEETGEFCEVDENRRDETIGPQPLYHVETCAREMVDGVCNNKPYLVLPRYWKSIALMRVVAPELLSFLLRINFLPFWREKPLSKVAVEAVGRKPFSQSGSKSE